MQAKRHRSPIDRFAWCCAEGSLLHCHECRPYQQAIHNELPWARIVVDHFHLVRGANTALDSVRRERQREAGRRRLPKGGAPLRQGRDLAAGQIRIGRPSCRPAR
jgi:transposase